MVISSRPPFRRRAVILGALGVALLAAGCSSAGVEPAGLTASPSSSASPTATASGAAKQKAAILDTYTRYWAAKVSAQRGNPDPKLFEGNAKGPLVEAAVTEAAEFKKYGVVREGKPGFAKITVKVDGATATVLACVDYRSWVVPDVKEGPGPRVLPNGTVLEKSDDVWLVVDSVKPASAFTC